MAWRREAAVQVDLSHRFRSAFWSDRSGLYSGTLWLVGTSKTIFPESFKPTWNKAARISGILVKPSSEWGAIDRAVPAYMHLSGIDGGYTFFAPNVPDTCQIGL